MRRFRTSYSRREQAAALLIVLAMVVLMTGLAVAYLSRTTSDRQVAHSSFHQSKVDQLAQSAMDLVIGDLQTEIANGSSPTPTASVPNSTPTATPFVYSLTAAANIVPVRQPVISAVPNLVRLSIRDDGTGGVNAVPFPGVSSHASAVNSTVDASADARLVNRARWNKHYLIPRPSPTPATDTSPIAAFSPAPDWVILTRNGPVAFSGWNATLADPTQPNNSYCVGRYAYAIYDEGALLDANVAGFPSNTTAAQYGPKGVSAFADLTALGLTQNDLNLIVGWRNYFSAGPSGNFPNFNFNAGAATAYVTSVLSNTNGFMSVPVPTSTPNNMSNTDQQFTTRQSLISLLLNSGLSNADVVAGANALQYLSTFSRELNAPSWAPTLNASDMGGNNGAGSIYAYKDNAANPAATPINPNLLNVRVCTANGCGFTRADGTTANPGELLINRRFPLTRLAGLGPTGIVTTPYSTIINGVSKQATAATIQRDFGLVWNSTSNRWDYVGPTGTTPQTSIETLWQVANENPGREPNFFELLKAAILNGSVGMGSGPGNTFVAAQLRYYDNTGTSAPTSSDFQIMQIGANIINQWDSGNVPIFFNFYDSTGNYELAGIKNLPYLSKLVFAPYWTSTTQFDAWLVPSLWNPHQNAPPASQNIRVAMPNAAQSMTAVLTDSGTPSSVTSAAVVGGTTQYMTVDAHNFLGTSPSGATSATAANGSTITQMPNNAGRYYGFHFAFTIPVGVTRNNAQTAYPDFGAGGCSLELQVQVGGIWKTYQRWKNCGPNHPLIFQPPTTGSWWNNNGLQDPEFVTLDPRTLRFGVWGNAYNQSVDTADLTAGTQTTLELSTSAAPSPYEQITALPPQGSIFTPSPSPSPTPTLYLYANNSDQNVHYADLDQVQRLGDATSSSVPNEMQLTAGAALDRPLVLAGAFQNGVFQSVAELGHVYRDQPWKTLSFAIAAPTASPYPTPRSADAGLLDVFTLHECSMEAGKTSLNTKQSLVLKAILGQGTSGGTITRLNDSTTRITSTQRDAIVTALTNLTTSQSMVNKAELVTRFSNDPSVTGLGNKEARECVLRAFSDAGQTRTWNLLIDLIAQSGRYPPNANSLAGFNVDGEVHYWVHVAIDRFTGQVLDKQIEVVNE